MGVGACRTMKKLFLVLSLMAGIFVAIWWGQRTTVGAHRTLPESVTASVTASHEIEGARLSSLKHADSANERVDLPVLHSRGGRLVIDAQTRTELERMVALYPRNEGVDLIEAATQNWPMEAQREAKDLYQRYLQYDQALATSMPVGASGDGVLDEAHQQLKTLKELRARFFGDAAAPMFGQEEARQQRLLDDATAAMRSKGMSLDAAIEEAQARLAQDLASSGYKPAAPDVRGSATE